MIDKLLYTESNTHLHIHKQQVLTFYESLCCKGNYGNINNWL